MAKRKAAASKSSKRVSKKRGRKPSYEESDSDDDAFDQVEGEEEEGGGGGLVTMEDISSDDSSDEEELKEEINNEDLFETDEDYDKLMALPEIEREAILSERYEKKKEELDRKKAAREQRKLEKAQKKKASGGKTVKKSTRNRDVSGKKGAKKSAMEELRKKRGQKLSEKSDEEEEEEGDVEDDDDGDEDFGSSQDKKTRGYKSNAEEEDEALPEATLDDLISGRIVLRHDWLLNHIHESYFAEAVKDCYVRLGIGLHPDTGKDCYRLCKIVNVTKGQSKYAAHRPDGKIKVHTQFRLTLAFGTSEVSMRITPISNSRPTEDEFCQYKNQLRSKRIRFPTGREINKLSKKLKKIITSYVRTSEDIEKEIQQKKDMAGSLAATIKNLALDIERAKVEIIAAKEEETAATAEFDKIFSAYQKEQIENKAYDQGWVPTQRLIDSFDDDDDEPDDPEELGQRNVLRAAKRKRESEAMVEAATEKLSNLKKFNETRQQNHTKNKKVGGWAKINDRRKEENKKADYNTFKEMKKLKEEGKGKEENAYNPFARRPNKPKILWAVNAEEDDVKEEKKVEESKPQEDKDGKPKEEASNLSQGSTGATNFHYDQDAIDREKAEKAKKVEDAKKKKGLGAGGDGTTKQRKGMSFADYLKKRKGE